MSKLTPIFSARFALFCTTELYADRIVYTTGVSIKKQKREIPLENISAVEYSPIPGYPGMKITTNSGEQIELKIYAKDREKLVEEWRKLKDSIIGGGPS